MKNLKTILEVTSSKKWGQTSQRALKSEIENIFKAQFESQDIEIFECEKGFNVELFDAEGRAFILNINPVIRAYDYDVVFEQECYLDLQEQKEQDAKDRKAKADKKKEQDRLKREQAKAKRVKA